MQKIIHYLIIHASTNSVYSAILTSDGLSKWWSTQVKSDGLNTGNIVHFTFLKGFNPEMKLINLKENELIEWECIDGHDLWKENKFTFQLTDIDGETGLMFTQEYASPIKDQDYGTYNFNWAYYLQSLKDYCETGVGKPFVPESAY